jgi:SAM-dependent methyltransferase
MQPDARIEVSETIDWPKQRGKGLRTLPRLLGKLLKAAVRQLARLPFSFGTSRMLCGAHVTRYTMYRELAAAIQDPNRGEGKAVLSISHSEILVDVLGLDRAKIVQANYPEHNAIDLRTFGDGEFDYVLSDQVLEHVQGNPQLVFDESLRVLKPGGIAVHTTCFINPVHGAPSDFWRFTPEALTLLSRNFSEVLCVGGFGNRAIWIVAALGLRMHPVPHATWHPLHKVATTNDPLWPVSTWIVARK